MEEIGLCEIDCTESMKYCCICCPKKEECNVICWTAMSLQRTVLIM